jgi:hypothetical protein
MVEAMSDQNSDPRPFEPPVPAVPRYGEYAPADSPTPATPSDVPVPAQVPANPYGVPGYAAPVTPPNMYDAPLKRKRRTWDLVLTIILLVFATFGTLAGLGYAAIFSDPAVLSAAMRQQGFTGFSGTIGAAPVILAVSHLLLYVVALGLSIPLLMRGRIVVFWIPLVAGLLAAIIFVSVIASVIASDPGFLQRYSG